MKQDMDAKASRLGLITLLLVLGVIWIALSRVPLEAASGRTGGSPLPGDASAAPDFTLETLDGQTITLSDLEGQVVLINFWASWCLACREEMPAIQQVYERYRDQGFVVLAVNLEEDDAQVAAFVRQLDLTFPVPLDRDGVVFNLYRARALPSTFFIGRTGVIRGTVVGELPSRAFIESQVVPLLTHIESE